MKNKRIEFFNNPPVEYRAKPFWSWNGELEKNELIRQVHIMKEMGFGGFFIHSRSGLITEYLGEEWFELINAVADESEKIGLETWLYDEDRWPSGSAGGFVTENPDFRMKSLKLRETSTESYVKSEDDLYVFIAKIDDINVNYYKRLNSEDDVETLLKQAKQEYQNVSGEWKVLIFSLETQESSPKFNGNTYLDTMNIKATQSFINITHNEYLKRCENRVGKSIKGIFTDEPYRGDGMGNLVKKDGVKTCSIAWTDDVFKEFEERYGYDALEFLPELFYRPFGERFAPIKQDYFDLTNNLFIERFMKPLNEWCKEHNMQFTGHLLHEDSLTNQAAPNGSLMRSYEYMGCPGIDILGAFTRSYWVPKQLASVGRQLGKKWLLSELYGCSGWELTFKNFKASGDWQALFGINMRCPHLSWYTMEGMAKRDYPVSILHQSTWYPYFSLLEDYFSRFGLFMSEGKAACDVLVINPVESVWSQAYLGWANWIFTQSEDVKVLEEQYVKIFNILTESHIDFDYADEQMLSNYAAVCKDDCDKAILKVGEAVYSTVVLGGIETIRETTYEIIKKFAAFGGKVVFVGDAPEYVDCTKSDKLLKLAEKAFNVPFDKEKVAEAIKNQTNFCFSVKDECGNEVNTVFLQSRLYDNGDIGIVILNTELEKGKEKISIEYNTTEKYYCEIWDFKTGKKFYADDMVKYENGKLVIETSLLAAETKAFVLCKVRADGLEILSVDRKEINEIVLDGEYDYKLNEKNVCVLDFAEWRINGGEWNSAEEVLKLDKKIRKQIGAEQRSGRMMQPWYQIKKGLENHCSVDLRYSFEISVMPDSKLFLAAERPELMNYAINGIPLTKHSEGFWIDTAFKLLEIPKESLKLNENIITVHTNFNNLTNIEAIYIVGDFGVKLDGNNCSLDYLPQKIGCGNLYEYNLPFYTGEVTYIINANHYKKINYQKNNSEKYFLNFKDFHGVLVKISSSSLKETLVGWEPYEADITEAIEKNEDIYVTVVGSRRNVFGPLHLVPAEHQGYTPSSYETEGDNWSDAYSFARNSLDKISIKKYVCKKER